MTLWDVYRVITRMGRAATVLVVGLIASACSLDKPSGSIQVVMVQPSGPSCQYKIAPATVSTLTSLSKMQGAVGSVMYNSQDLDSNANILLQGLGFSSVTVNFSGSGGTYYPQDYASLYSISLYHEVEVANLLFASLDPSGNLANLGANPSLTTIVYQAHGDTTSEGGSSIGTQIDDNAEYYSSIEGAPGARDYIFDYPTSQITEMPLAENQGVIGHEYTHMLFEYAFYKPFTSQGIQWGSQKPTQLTIESMDEGNADYMGFMTSGDPEFFSCSFNDSSRNLDQLKQFTQDIAEQINDNDPNYDTHEGGAIWASIQYAIGSQIGFQKNATALVKLMNGIISCGNTGGSLNMNFGDLAQCHMRFLDGPSQGIASQIYSQNLGPYSSGGGSN